MAERKIGEVSHFFARPMVAAIRLTGALKIGDTIHIKGATTDFVIRVASMQIDREPVGAAGAGEEIGIQVPDRARDRDEVFAVSSE